MARVYLLMQTRARVRPVVSGIWFKASKPNLTAIFEADRSLIRQAATLLLKSEQMQEAVVRGEPVDSDSLIRMASTVKRVLAAISAKSARRKPTAPTVADYLAPKAAENLSDA
ncbi:hypothetical protein [Bradyrhizobium canariense]|nr:hypothetical protein [Bradyrhizobium canariense]